MVCVWYSSVSQPVQMRTALREESESEEDKADVIEAVEAKVALYNDCIAAMAFLLDKERGFHRVRHAVARFAMLKRCISGIPWPGS